jgi:hypothetical protein
MASSGLASPTRPSKKPPSGSASAGFASCPRPKLVPKAPTTCSNLVLGEDFSLLGPMTAAPGVVKRPSRFAYIVLYGAFVWARRALNSPNRRFPARAVAKDGIYSCGRGDSGQLGHGDTSHYFGPTKITAFDSERIRLVAASGSRAIAISERDNFYIWGKTGRGR